MALTSLRDFVLPGLGAANQVGDLVGRGMLSHMKRQKQAKKDKRDEEIQDRKIKRDEELHAARLQEAQTRETLRQQELLNGVLGGGNSRRGGQAAQEEDPLDELMGLIKQVRPDMEMTRDGAVPKFRPGMEAVYSELIYKLRQMMGINPLEGVHGKSSHRSENPGLAFGGPFSLEALGITPKPAVQDSTKPKSFKYLWE